MTSQYAAVQILQRILQWICRASRQLRFLVQQTREGERGFSFPAYQMFARQSQWLAGVATVLAPGPTMVCVPGGTPEMVRREYVSSSYFTMLGLHPAAGRFFTPEEDLLPFTQVLISDRFWEREFGRNPNAMGSTLSDYGRPLTIVGVMPPGFTGVTPECETHLWYPISGQMWHNGKNDPGYGANDHAAEGFPVLGRLKPGVSERQALTELNAINQQYLQARAQEVSVLERAKLLERRISLVSGAAGRSPLGRKYLKPLAVLMGLVSLVLLLACANIGNMLLARAAARSREIAVRLAVGAGRKHLVRQFLVESLLLALLGGGGGLIFAEWGARLLVNEYGAHFLPVARIDVHPDSRILAFTVAVTLGSGLMFGSLPILWAARSNVAPLLKGATETLRLGRWNAGKVLVIMQTTLSILVLTGAALFTRSLLKLKNIDTGFVRDHLVLCDIVTPTVWTADGSQAVWRLIDRIRHWPGVISASAGTVPSDTPLFGVEVEGCQAAPGEKVECQMRDVIDGTFETLRTPLVLGRTIDRRDCQTNSTVVLVNECFVRKYCPDLNPLGRRVRIVRGPGPPAGPFEIVGVVGNARYTSPKQEPLPEIFTAGHGFWGARLLIRTAHNPHAFMSTLPQSVQREEPGLRVFHAETLEQATDNGLTQERMLASLSSFFGLIAMVLAALGIFGVVSFTVSRRTTEIGIRMALGAQRHSVIWMVLKDTLLMLAAGVALAVPLVWAGGRLVASLLYNLAPMDPGTLAIAILLLSGAALLAGYLPARRAAQVDPLVALRCD